MLSKLWRIIRIQFSVNFAYRGNILFWLLIHLLSFVVLYCFWSAIYSDRALVQGISFAQMMSYLIAISIIREFTLVTPEYEINSTIKQGKLSAYLVRPFSYPVHVLLSSSLWHFIETIIGLVIYSMIAHIILPNMQWAWSWWILPLILLGHIICSLVALCLGTLAFWLTEASAFFYYKEILILLTSGMFFPKATTPIWFQKIMEFLPFYHTMGIPGEILVGKAPVNVLSSSLINLSLWTLVLSLIAMIIWNRGVRKYEAVGN